MLAALLLPAAASLHARARRALSDSPGSQAWQRVSITILARGSHVSGSSGNMDSYLVLLSAHKNSEPVPARLVDYHSSFESEISDDAIISRPQFRVRVTEADYCAMDVKAFVVKRAFDPAAIEKLQGNLPCMVVRH
jgi:hypothetical protein